MPNTLKYFLCAQATSTALKSPFIPRKKPYIGAYKAFSVCLYIRPFYF